MNAHYNMNSSKNTNQSVVKTTDTSLSFHTGGVADPGFEYSFAPYVYTEKSSGRIVLDYDVDLYGAMWKQSYKTPDLICIRISPFSQYPYLSTYTRDIRFKEIGDDGLEISVLVFNNSFSDCKGGSIKIGMGEPDIYRPSTELTMNFIEFVSLYLFVCKLKFGVYSFIYDVLLFPSLSIKLFIRPIVH